GRLMGVLDGTERLERYRRVDSGNKEGHAVIELESLLESLTEGNPGKLISCHRTRFMPSKAGRRDRLP
ncbi:MAG TPA: hypothetical protein VFU31_07450, partial [Candidatus Binatia bacterium]|nr:hypothetical protein [Candidatus Binatia bacterium]